MERQDPGVSNRWPVTAAPPPLAPGDVQVWRVDIGPGSGGAPLLERLSPDERTRADRFVFPRHRQRFIRGRAALRGLLARQLGVAPREVPLRTAPGGKPFVAHPGAPALYFNVSHSNDLALVAMTLGAEIGIDIEAERPPTDDWLSLARRYFAIEEVEALERYASGHRVHAFFRGWTRKEAIVKLLGDGLRMPLDRFIVPLDEEAAAPVLLSDGGTVPWHLTPLAPGPGFHAACATYREPARVLLGEWVERAADVPARA